MVVPPAPQIVRRSANAISIPIGTLKPATGKFEEHEAVATSARVGSQFGLRSDPFTGRSRMHKGVDLKAKWGDPVGASRPGIVHFAGVQHGFGNLIVVDHGGGVSTYYAHLSSFAVQVGSKVSTGTLLGYAGSTGRSTSPHLHYEVRVDGVSVNPLQQVALDPASAYFAGDQAVVAPAPAVVVKEKQIAPAVVTAPAPAETKPQPKVESKAVIPAPQPQQTGSGDISAVRKVA